MNNLINLVKKNYLIISIILFSILVRIFYFSYDAVWWDSSVYIGIGKYIFSLGNSGFWEISRPLVFPLILGFFWKIGANPYIAGRVIDVLFSVGCVFLTYLIADRIFNKRIALFSAFILSFTPTFFNNGNYLLTGIGSTFFALLGVYFFIRKRYLLTGLFCGIAFMTRFLQLFVFIVIFVFLLFQKKDLLKRSLLVLGGFLIPVAPYLILHLVLYSNPIFPFLHQFYMTANTGFQWHEPFYFYFANILKENFLVILVLLSPFYYIKVKDKGKHLLLAVLLVFLLFYTITAHKETRFLITLMPYLYILIGLGLFFILDIFKKKWIRVIVPIILLLAFFIVSLNDYDTGKDDRFDVFWDYMNKDDVQEEIWVSSPVFAVYSDKKVVPIYYDVFDSDKIAELQDSEKPEHILIDACDLDCHPADTDCPPLKNGFINSLIGEFNIIFNERRDNCDRFILSS